MERRIFQADLGIVAEELRQLQRFSGATATQGCRPARLEEVRMAGPRTSVIRWAIWEGVKIKSPDRVFHGNRWRSVARGERFVIFRVAAEGVGACLGEAASTGFPARSAGGLQNVLTMMVRPVRWSGVSVADAGVIFPSHLADGESEAGVQDARLVGLDGKLWMRGVRAGCGVVPGRVHIGSPGRDG